jgi:hypothetical protein
MIEQRLDFRTRVQAASHSRPPHRRSTLEWFHAAKTRGPLSGFVITWDVDSGDSSQRARLYRLIYGYTSKRNGREYRYPGFVEREGVRYLGQSVLLVREDLVPELTAGVARIGVAFDGDRGSIG